MDTHPQTREDVSARVIHGEFVILDRSRGQVHQLNATASRIWELCAGRLTEAEIADEIARSFEVEPGRAASDVKETLARFRELELLGERPATGPEG